MTTVEAADRVGRLAGKRAVVTGGARGIGAATVEKFAARLLSEVPHSASMAPSCSSLRSAGYSVP